MYAVLLLPEKLYEFDLKGIKVSFVELVTKFQYTTTRQMSTVSDVCAVLWFK